jgi:predicted AlkP superfamily pyrophosphatase or phosphodiesterase
MLVWMIIFQKYLGKATVKQTNNLDSTKTNSLQYVDYDYLKNVFSNNFDFINEILNQFKDQYPSELSELKKAVNEKNKENVLKLSHHIKTTVTTLSTHTPIRQQLENIDNYVAKDNWVFVNDNLNKMLLSEPILMNEIETIIKKEKIA